MHPTLSQQPLHTHVGVHLEYMHMLPYAGTVQSCNDNISPGAARHNKQNLQKIVAKHHNQAAKGQELECGLMTAMMSCKDLLIVSKTCMCIMTTSSHTMSVTAYKSAASSESLLM
jgi:hypothetical protein